MWSSWSEFWDMGGRGAFVWGAYAMVMLAIAAEVLMVRARLHAARRQVVRDAIDLQRPTSE